MRRVEISDGVGGHMWRDLPETAYPVDMDEVAKRLKREFQSSFHHAPMTTDMFAEMIAAGVLLVLEELAGQAEQAECSFILIPGPPKEGS